MPGEAPGHWPGAACSSLQQPAHAGLVRIGVVVGHVGSAPLFDEHPLAGEQLHHPRDDLVQHGLQRLVVRRGHFQKNGHTVGAAPVHAVQHQAVQVNVEIGRRAEALDQHDRAAVGLVCLDPSLPEQVARDDAVHHLQHRRHQRHQLGLCSQQQAQRDGQPNLGNPHPLAHRHARNDVLAQVGRRLRHAPRAARRTEAASLAAERQQLVVAAVTAMQAQKAVGQDGRIRGRRRTPL